MYSADKDLEQIIFFFNDLFYVGTSVHSNANEITQLIIIMA
jgi:hypothetical protein